MSKTDILLLLLFVVGLTFVGSQLYFNEPARVDRNYILDQFCLDNGFEEYDRAYMRYLTNDFNDTSYVSCHRFVMIEGEFIHQDRWVEWNEYLVFNPDILLKNDSSFRMNSTWNNLEVIDTVDWNVNNTFDRSIVDVIEDKSDEKCTVVLTYMVCVRSLI